METNHFSLQRIYQLKLGYMILVPEWNDSEVLVWYPNQPDEERIFQFTIMIDGDF